MDPLLSFNFFFEFTKTILPSFAILIIGEERCMWSNRKAHVVLNCTSAEALARRYGFSSEREDEGEKNALVKALLL
jgi:hypothetical protein